jgi:Spy/CpxP family protein refolding chaperone
MRRSKKEIMKLSLRRTVLYASLAGALAVVPAGIALANEGSQGHARHHREHREGLMGDALRLGSLTPEQRSSVDELMKERRAANVPVRQADARVLTELAQQVEQAKVDPGALETTLNAEKGAAVARGAVDKDTLVKLHALLTPAQRNELVDQLEAAHANHRHQRADAHEGERSGAGGKLGLTAEQRTAIRANLKAEGTPKGEHHGELRAALESFRGDAFDPSALVAVESGGERTEKLAQAMVPVLTPAQRATFASHLRARAAREGS